MSATPTTESSSPTNSQSLRKNIAAIGAPLVEIISFLGALGLLMYHMLQWVWRSIVLKKVRFGRPAFYAQIVRLGARSIGVVCLVSGCIGFILALQMEPPLREFGQTEKVANIIAVAMFRELGPLISAVVLVGFAGASVAAELGTMVVGEEIEALQAHALNPIRFLVMPRILSTTLCMVVLAIMGELVAVVSGAAMGIWFLDIPARIYYDNSLEQLKMVDFVTGLVKAGVFGTIMGVIACHNGLSVEGGAAGVGRATTNTVVQSVVLIIFADLIFTAVFYALGWA